jgi:orotidine-5'-phosphate decarboxylase
MARHFRTLLNGQWAQNRFLCVGLDTDVEKIPESVRQLRAGESIIAFNKAIIEATKDIAGSYKPNSAFYEAHGDEGVSALRATIEYIHEQAPDVPVILDAKRGDIGNTNGGYIASAFEHMRADAITVNPYLGSEALQPFFDREEKGIIVLCRTSNPGAGELQDLKVDGEPLHMVVARRAVQHWNGNNNCALVVGATYPDELREIRRIAPDMPILIPGIGAQGGDLERTVLAARDSRGQGMMVASSRSVIFASSNADFASAARSAALELDVAIKNALLQSQQS